LWLMTYVVTEVNLYIGNNFFWNSGRYAAVGPV